MSLKNFFLQSSIYSQENIFHSQQLFHSNISYVFLSRKIVLIFN